MASGFFLENSCINNIIYSALINTNVDFSGLSFARQLKTLDENLTSQGLDADLESYFQSTNARPNVFNTVSNVNPVNNNSASTINAAQLANQLRSLRKDTGPVSTSTRTPTPSSTEFACLSFSLTRQYILYDTYRTGSEKKAASMIVGQSPYTSPPDVQTVASTEEIDAELEKVKELFAAGFIQQGKIFELLIEPANKCKKGFGNDSKQYYIFIDDYMARVLALNMQKEKAVGN